MLHWIEPEAINIPPDLHEVAGGCSLVAQALARRGLTDPAAARAFLDPTAYTPAPPPDLPGIPEAVERVRQAIRTGEQIAIWGDFDADGQTATAVLLQTLRRLGARAVFHIPARDEGHGVHEAGVQKLVASGVRLVITCDTGVTAHAAIARAASLGADVIVTDHHVASDPLPKALAIINPHFLPERHPMATLSGVGVAYQLARALDPALADDGLDLVAIGMVADVAALVQDARYLVQRGIERLREGRRLGLQAMCEAAGLRPEGITEEHIGFVLGPRLNALGRLAHAARGVDLLTTDHPTQARILATEVEGLQGRRQWLTKQVTDAALAQIEREPGLLADYDALVLAHPTWPEGIIGIVAGRLAERFHKPTLLIATPPGKLARGSGRSVAGLDLMAALNHCTHLLDRLGGHAGAAGFSMEAERIPELRACLSRAISAQPARLLEQGLSIDAYVGIPDLTLDLANSLSQLAPFGPGNPPLTLALRDVRIVGDVSIGRTAEHRRLTVEDSLGRTQTVFWWQGTGWPAPSGQFDLAFSIRAADYQGMAQAQIEWIDARDQEPEGPGISPSTQVQVIDCRHADSPDQVLRQLVSSGDLQVWAEAQVPVGIEARSRLQLVPSQRLAIWTAPPSYRVLRSVLEQVQPQEVVLFALDPALDEMDRFLPRLAGLIKFALQERQGWIDLEVVAASTAQRLATVRAGLEWFAAGGQVEVRGDDGLRWRLAPGTAAADVRAQKAAGARLRALLAETAAYRAYVQGAPPLAVIETRPMSNL